MEPYSPNSPSVPSHPHSSGSVQWEKWDTVSDFHTIIQLSETKFALQFLKPYILHYT